MGNVIELPKDDEIIMGLDPIECAWVVDGTDRALKRFDELMTSGKKFKVKILGELHCNDPH